MAEGTTEDLPKADAPKITVLPDAGPEEMAESAARYASKDLKRHIKKDVTSSTTLPEPEDREFLDRQATMDENLRLERAKAHKDFKNGS